MSSFFTLPASQKKRKRSQPSSKPNGTTRRHDVRENESISGSDISDTEEPSRPVEADGSGHEDDESQDEDPAAKRIRLAEQYLANTEKELLDDGGFDAAEIDRENLRRRISERLKKDTAEGRGKLYKRIADDLDWERATRKTLRCHNVQKSMTGVSMQGNYIYGVSKDLHVVKWELPSSDDAARSKRVSQKAEIIKQIRGKTKATQAQHHHKEILCVAASPDGKFIATGGADKKLIIWDAKTLKPLKVFLQHRDAVTAVAFRRGTNQLFSASKDRTVKIWSLDELAYVETLFGHQDEVVDVGALGQEKCVTVGARDRTARLWKVVEESQLVFRGGGASGTTKALEALKKAYYDKSDVGMQEGLDHHEGSIDRVAMIDDDTFITGSDNGSLSLWNVNKKKAVFTLPLAHGLDEPLPLDQASAEIDPDETLDVKGRGGRQPRWITALKAISFSDVFVSGSWDGYVRIWKISNDRRRIENLGAVGAVAASVDMLLENEGLSSDSLSKDALQAMQSGVQGRSQIQGVVNDLAIMDQGEKSKGYVVVAAAVGKEHRLGRWKEMSDAKNYVVLFEVPRRQIDNDGDGENATVDEVGGLHDGDGFEGFD